MQNKETFIIDIDETIIFSRREYCNECNKLSYKIFTYDTAEIERINKAYNAGHTIIIFTGRGWDQYDITVKQLFEAGVKYHNLIMGKPHGKYIDKDSEKSLKGIIE